MDCVFFNYKSINPEITGRNLKNMIKAKGFDVKDIQKILKLSCQQPIYRWFNGVVMPSLNHMYVLSTILNVHMEKLLIGGYADICDVDGFEFESIASRVENMAEYLCRTYM